LSGHRKKANLQAELTSLRVQTKVLVRTLEESELVRATHFLKSAEVRACQDMERMCKSAKNTIIESSAWNMDSEGQTDMILRSPCF